MPNNPKDINVALARAIASRDLPSENVAKASEKLAELPEIRRIDICKYGTCVDFWFNNDEFRERFNDLVNYDHGQLGEIRVFKYGIINPEIFHVQAEFDLEEIAPPEQFR